MNTYEKCCSIRHALLTRTAESQIYESWSDEFRLSNIRDFFSKTIKKWSEKESLEKEMKELGFCKFSDEDEGHLIPLWLYPFLCEDVETRCIDGTTKLSKSKMDTDNRFGYLAYSIMPKKGK